LGKAVNILLVLFSLGVIIRVIWQARKSSGQTRTSGWVLFAFGLLPFSSLLVSDAVLLEEMKDDSFCGSCHPMQPFVNGLQDTTDTYLSTKHAKRHLILEQHCYTCHTDYALMGGVKAKLRGLRHLYVYYGRSNNIRPKLYSPYPNANCLRCHSGTDKYEHNPTHEPISCQLKVGDISCLECHGPAHPGEEAGGSK